MDARFWYALFNILLLGAVAFGFVYLFVLAVLVHDTRKILNAPFTFIAEWIVVAFVPSATILFFVVSRDVPVQKIMPFFWGIFIKFAIFHLLLQLSGYLNYEFENKY